MTTQTSASVRYQPDGTSTKDQKGANAASRISLPRLYFLRSAYLLMGVGLALTKWPLLINGDGPWPLFEGVVICMLVAMSLLSFLGLRYPLQMLPILLFELGWKFIWVGVVVVPLWITDQLEDLGHREHLPFLPRGFDRARPRAVALCRRAICEEARRSVADGGEVVSRSGAQISSSTSHRWVTPGHPTNP